MSHRKNNFLRGSGRSNISDLFGLSDEFDFSTALFRRGVSGMAAVFIVTGIFIASLGFLSWKFEQTGSSASQNFFERTSALVSETFGDMFSSRQNAPAAEIDLGERATSVNGGEHKNTAAAADNFLSVQPNAKKKSAKNISENKNPIPSAKNPAIQSSANENNISSNSSSGSELPVAESKKFFALSPPVLCDVAKIQTPNHKILFNEIAWMGSIKGASDEWIELKNNSGGDISLAGWQILSSDGKNNSTGSTSSPQASSFGATPFDSAQGKQDKSPQIKIIFEERNRLTASELYLLKRNGDNSALNVPADGIYSGALANGGIRLKIFGPDCELSDEIDASKKWPAGDNAAKRTMERSSLDLSWHTSGVVGGTPKADNSAAFLTGPDSGALQQESAGNTSLTAGAASQGAAPLNNATSAGSVNSPRQSAPMSAFYILISGVQTTGGAGKSNNDFIKLYNAGDSVADISGWQLKKRTQSGSESSVKVFPTGASVVARGYFIWANSENNFASAAGANVSSTSYLADNNSVALFDSSGKIIDAVAWGSGHANPFVEGSAYPTNPAANQMLARKIVGTAMQDTQNNQEDFEIK